MMNYIEEKVEDFKYLLENDSSFCRVLDFIAEVIIGTSIALLVLSLTSII